jgi:hypothetical protein
MPKRILLMLGLSLTRHRQTLQSSFTSSTEANSYVL